MAHHWMHNTRTALDALEARKTKTSMQSCGASPRRRSLCSKRSSSSRCREAGRLVWIGTLDRVAGDVELLGDSGQVSDIFFLELGKADTYLGVSFNASFLHMSLTLTLGEIFCDVSGLLYEVTHRTGRGTATSQEGHNELYDN